MAPPTTLPADQAALLARWASFLKLAVPVLEQAKNEPALRYVMMFDQLPGDRAGEWAQQVAQVAEFAAKNREALAAAAPERLSRAGPDAWFSTPGVECSINAAAVLYACQDPQYANVMWGMLTQLAAAPDAPRPAPFTEPPAVDPNASNIITGIMRSIQDIAEQQVHDDPALADAAAAAGNPYALIRERVMRLMQSPQMEGLVANVMQVVENNNQNPRIMQDLVAAAMAAAGQR